MRRDIESELTISISQVRTIRADQIRALYRPALITARGGPLAVLIPFALYAEWAAVVLEAAKGKPS